MKLEKAIEILTLMGTPGFAGHTEDILAARKLSIEALKYFQDDRTYCEKIARQKLPGETEE